MTTNSDAACSNNATWTAKDGLNFTTYCGEDIISAAYNSSIPTTQANLTECIDSCAETSGYCYGVVYKGSNSSCWELSNQTASSDSNLVANSNLITALTNQSQLYIPSTDCPYQNLSTQTSSSGVEFTINCNMEVNKQTYCPWNQSTPSLCPIHVDSLEECMDICVEAHPLCQAASWNPGMIKGYQNCYLYEEKQPLVSFSSYILHTAVINLPDLASGCPTDTTYTSQVDNQNATFDISCSQTATSATNLTWVHESNITSCMDACVSYTGSPACEAVIFDASMSIGYENCQLLNSVKLVSSASNVNYASLASSNSSSPSNSTSSSNSGSGSSKAWIAGPVIGGIVAIAALGLGFWWWKRRKNRAPPPNNLQSAEYKPVYPRPHYAAEVEANSLPAQPVELPPKPVEQQAGQSHELNENTVHELPE